MVHGRSTARRLGVTSPSRAVKAVRTLRVPVPVTAVLAPRRSNRTLRLALDPEQELPNIDSDSELESSDSEKHQQSHDAQQELQQDNNAVHDSHEPHHHHHQQPQDDMLSVLTPDTIALLDALQRAVTPQPFNLPFSSSEVAAIDARAVEHRPLPYGKISKCVFVSKPPPPAALPQLKCNCFADVHLATTKRATQIADTKALLLNGGKRQLRTPTKPLATPNASKPAPPPLLCGERCHNRMLLISCSSDTCSAPDASLCSNRAILRREVKSMRVAYIPGCGFGLLANAPILASDFVIEYVGEVIDDEECEQRMIQSRDRGETHFYVLELDKDTLIDARYRSNESRFINHSCDPNCVTQKWNVDGALRIGIFARRNIQLDEEITIDYNFSHFGEAVDCKCGSSACTGKIGLKVKKRPLPTAATAALTVRQQQRRVEAEELVPSDLERPVAIPSLVLLKTAQLDTKWLDAFGFQKRRLFLSHAARDADDSDDSEEKEEDEEGESDNIVVVDNRSSTINASARTSTASSPSASNRSSPSTDEWATQSTLSLSPASFTSNALSTRSSNSNSNNSNWFTRIQAGDHLAELRAQTSFICGGKFDWTDDLDGLVSSHKPLPQHRSKQQRHRRRKRLSLLDARAQLVVDLHAFASGTSKWNERLSTPAGALDAQRITRFIQQTQLSARTNQITQASDLNEDECHRCGLSGELICCDGCPAAFHLNCTNLSVVPLAREAWFCPECLKPRTGSIATSTDERAARRQLRTHAVPLVPTRKRIFAATAQLQQQQLDAAGAGHPKKKLKRRSKAAAADRSYRQLENMPLPSVTICEVDDMDSE